MADPSDLELISPEVVVHLAAETGTGQSVAQATRHGSVNVVGTTEMLDALLRARAIPAHIVLASSRAVYGEGRWLAEDGIAFYPGWRDHNSLVEGRWEPVSPSGAPARPLPQEVGATEPRPTSVHAATKLAQEHLCGAWAAATGGALSVLRLQNVYGPGQSLVSAATVAREVQTLLEDSRYRDRAEQVSREMKLMPTAQEAVNLLERLQREQRPLRV